MASRGMLISMLIRRLRQGSRCRRLGSCTLAKLRSVCRRGFDVNGHVVTREVVGFKLDLSFLDTGFWNE